MDFFNTHISNEAKFNVNQVLDTTWLNEGKYVKQFEKSLADDFGLANPLTVNSCTSALHLSLTCLGIGEGDEVILPAQTFIATGMAILMVGAKPIFADIEKTTGNISVQSISEKITEKTKAIIPVHWGGNPCQIHAINEFGIPVIEDAAHAFGAAIDGRPIGSISKLTCFSFQAIKFLTTGDGGLICTTDSELYEQLKRRKWFGFDKSTLTRKFEGDRDCLVNEIGFKYHMNDIAAAIGLGNLQDAKARLNKRLAIASIYSRILSNIDGIRLLDKHGESSNWLYTILVEDRVAFINKMKSKNIPVSVVDRRIDEHPVFGGKTPNLEGQEFFDKHQISLPVHEALTLEDVDLVTRTISEGW